MSEALPANPTQAAPSAAPGGFANPKALALLLPWTSYRWGYLLAGLFLVARGLFGMLYGISQSSFFHFALPEPALYHLLRGHPVAESLKATHSAIFWAFVAVWCVGWGVFALGVRRNGNPMPAPSEAVGTPLYARLANEREFSWGTLALYGGGILVAELVLILGHTLLAGGVVDAGQAQAKSVGLALAPTLAFSLALFVAGTVAFLAGFLGAMRAQRLATPEATLGFIYFGLPVPLLLTLLTQTPTLQFRFGYSLREVLYVASLLGRPELGFWLVFGALALAMVLGITSGFVATGSGRVDFRTGFEVFVAGRHVQVFHPTLLVGVFLVLLFGVLPPIIIFGMVKAGAAAVERIRVRRLGLVDPLLATAALHHAKSKEQSPTAMMTALSVGGVGVGVMSLIIVLSVMSGFEEDLQKKILGANAHVVITKSSDSFEDFADVMKKAATVPGVKGQTPFVYSEVMIATESSAQGTIIKGIDPETIGSVSDLPNNVSPPDSISRLKNPAEILLKPREGELGFDGKAIYPEDDSKPQLKLKDGSGGKAKPKSKREELEEDPIIGTVESRSDQNVVLPGIILGRELAASLRVVVGDRVNVLSPFSSELGPQGPMAKTRPFRVAGIFYSGMFEYDSKSSYIRIDEAQKFFNVKGATGIELKVSDIDDARRISRQIYDKLEGYPYRAKDWGEMNKNLFSALRLEKLVMAIILSIIVIVAAGLIVATVIMLVLEKRKEIAVLKALGVPDGGIVKIFLAEGLQIGLAGGLLGLAAGLALCQFIEKFGIKLDPEVYYIPALPVKVEAFQTMLAVVIAILVTYLGSIYPALKASKVEPVEGLKAE